MMTEAGLIVEAALKAYRVFKRSREGKALWTSGFSVYAIRKPEKRRGLGQGFAALAKKGS